MAIFSQGCNLLQLGLQASCCRDPWLQQHLSVPPSWPTLLAKVLSCAPRLHGTVITTRPWHTPEDRSRDGRQPVLIPAFYFLPGNSRHSWATVPGVGAVPCQGVLWAREQENVQALAERRPQQKAPGSPCFCCLPTQDSWPEERGRWPAARGHSMSCRQGQLPDRTRLNKGGSPLPGSCATGQGLPSHTPHGSHGQHLPPMGHLVPGEI